MVVLHEAASGLGVQKTFYDGSGVRLERHEGARNRNITLKVFDLQTPYVCNVEYEPTCMRTKKLTNRNRK